MSVRLSKTTTDGSSFSGTAQQTSLTQNYYGEGVPAGGSTNQVLQKLSGTSYDTGWATLGEITGVTAGTNLNGGGTEGTVTLNLDTNITGDITFDGNVGIGTTSPESTSTLQIQNTSANNEILFSGASHTNIYSATTAGFDLGTTSSGGSSYVRFLTENTERLRIDSSGRVGIGTTSPSAALDCAGQAVFGDSGHTKLTTYTDVSYSGIYNGSSLTSDESFYFGNGSVHWYTNGSERIRIDSSGNVGINTTSPSFKLSVNEDSGSTIAGFFKTNQTDSFISFQGSGTSATSTVRIGANGDDLHAYVNGGYRFTVKGDGNVGIGTTAPSETLDVNGTANVTSLKIGGTAVTSSAAELNYSDGVTSNIQTQLDAKQDTLTFNAVSSNNTNPSTSAQIKTYVDGEVSNLIDSAPAALDTLNELAAALGDDANYASTVTTSLAGKQDVLSEGAFANGDKTKLDGIESSATADQTGAEIKSLYEGESDTNAFTDADHTKLDGIEASATADQTGAEIKTAYEAESDTNAFTDADHTKLDGIESSADVTDTANVTAAGALMDSELTDLAGVKGVTVSTLQVKPSEGAFVNGDKTKLDGIEASATADQTGAEIKSLYEGESDTNAFTDADHSKLDGIEASATADQTDAEIRTAVEAASDSNVFTDADHTKLDGIAASANNYSHPNHSGEVTSTGDGATVVADDVIDEANLKVDNSPTDDYVLTAKASAAGGLTWAEASGGGASAAGSAGQIQFNNGSGNLAADANLHWDDTNNRLGIGTASPSELLHIRKDAAAVVAIKAQNATANSVMEYQAGNDADNWWFGIDGSDNFGISDVTGQASQRLVITQSGNIGIGTSAPSETLSVVGDGSFTKSAGYTELKLKRTGSYSGTDPIGNILFYADTDSVGGLQVIRDGADDAAALQFFTQPTGGANSERMRIDSSGNIGIGTTSPSGKLEISGSGTLAKFTGTGTTTYLKITDATSSGGNFIGATGDSMHFWANNQKVVTFKESSGSPLIGIGTDTPSAALDCVGQAVFGGSGHTKLTTYTDSSYSGIYNGSSLTSDESFYFGSGNAYWYTDGAERMRIDSSGNVGIGTTSPTVKFDCRGNANFEQANANITINATSSYPYINMEENGTVRYQQAYDVTNNEFYFTAVESGSDMWFGTANAERMRIDSSGVATITNSNSGLVIKNSGASDKEWRVGGGSSGQFQITEVGVADRLTVLAGGNIGIGTAAPDEKLTLRLGNDEIFELQSSAQELFQLWKEGTTEEARMNIKHDGATKIHLRGNGISYFNGGNVGIGTAAPSRLLHLSSTGGTFVRLDTGEGDDFSVGANSNGWSVYNETDSSYSLVVDGSGNAGIGTASPSSKLHVAGDALLADGKLLATNTSGNTGAIYNGTSAAGDIRISGGNSATDGAGIVLYGGSHSATPDVTLFQTGSTERMRIDSTGNVGLGTTSPNANSKLEIAGRLRIGDGSAALPALSFSDSGDYDTGIFRASGDVMGFSTGGSERLRIDSSGNVGLGTASPSETLHTKQTGFYSTFFERDGGTTGTQGWLKIGMSSLGGSGADALLDAKHSLGFRTNGSGGTATLAMTIDDSQNVGIGTASPSQKLHVAGKLMLDDSNDGYIYLGNDSDQYIKGDAGSNWMALYTANSERFKISQDGAFGIGGANYGTSGQVLVSGGSGSAPAWQDNVAGESASHWVESGSNVYRSSGKVGIGTSSPSDLLTVGDGTNSVGITINKSDAGTGTLEFESAGTDKCYVRCNASEDLIFGTGDSDRVSILSGGNVGIGTTAPSHKLEIADSGNTLLNINGSGTNTYLKITDSSSSGGNFIGATGDTLHFWTDNTKAVTIDGSQRVGIGTDSPSQKLHVAGKLMLDDSNDGYIYLGNDSDQYIKGDAGSNWMALYTANSERFKISQDGAFGIGGANYGTSGQVLVSGGSGSAPAWQDNVAGESASHWVESGSNVYRSSGKVGIGTSSPSDLLTVGDGTNSVGITINKSDAGTGTLEFESAGTDKCYVRCNASEDLIFGTGDSDRVSILSGGNVGIGTTAPSHKLEIADSGNTLLNINGSGTNTYLKITDSTSSGGNFIGATGDTLHFWTDNSERLRIDSSGNVGISCTPSSTSTLQIQNANANNEIVFSGADHTNILSETTAGFDLGTNSTGGSSYVRFLTENSERVRIDSSGNVGIGTTSPAYKTQITDSSNCILSIVSGASSEASLYLGDSVATRGRIKYNNSDDTLDIYTNNNHRQTYTDEGQVYSPVLTLTAGDTVDIDFNKNNLQKLAYDGSESSLTLTGSAYAAGKTVRLYIDMTSSLENSFTVPNDWNNFGDDPSSLNGSGLVLVEFTCWGSSESDVTAYWREDTSSGGDGGGGGEGP